MKFLEAVGDILKICGLNEILAEVLGLLASILANLSEQIVSLLGSLLRRLPHALE